MKTKFWNSIDEGFPYPNLRKLFVKQYPQGDNYLFSVSSKGNVKLSYSNDYPLQHGKGVDINLPEKFAETIEKTLTTK